jgi:hypothetical protein
MKFESRSFIQPDSTQKHKKRNRIQPYRGREAVGVIREDTMVVGTSTDRRRPASSGGMRPVSSGGMRPAGCDRWETVGGVRPAEDDRREMGGRGGQGCRVGRN